MLSAHRKYIQFVIKTSKHCNLRCRYCYEFASLGDTTRISLNNCNNLYKNVARFLEEAGGKDYEVHFIWHGGEPLLIPVSYYETTFEHQNKELTNLHAEVKIRNLIQTNLTFLDQERINLLRKFDHIGVSADIIGELRQDIKGRSREGDTIKNMERLKLEGIGFGAIVVLHNQNLEHIHDVYSFFRDYNIPFRLLAIHEASKLNPIDAFNVSSDEITASYKSLYDEWICEKSFHYVEPIFSYTAISISYLLNCFPKRYYRKDTWVNTILVDTDGECYGYNDDYGNKQESYGNIFEDDLKDFFESENYLKSVQKAERQLAFNCVTCPYFGSCSGYPIAEGKNNEREEVEDGLFRCTVEKSVFEHIVNDLKSRLETDDIETLANFSAARLYATQGMKQTRLDMR